jgi:hypothetical protein
MTLAEYLEAYRLRRIRELKQEQQNLVAEISTLEAQKSAVDLARLRAEVPYPSLNVCPRCWIERGRERTPKRIGPPTAEPIGEFEVRMRCPDPDCHWVEVLTE